MSRKRALCSLACVAILSIVIMFPVVAQGEESAWLPPEVIVRTEGELATSAMALVADPAGQLHLFYPHRPDESVPGSIDYIYWDGSEWSQPVDIMVDPQGYSPSFVRATLDPQQVIHLVWHGGNNSLRHASAPLDQAGSARAWSTPQILAIALGEADLIAGLDGTLYVAYADRSSLGTVSLIRSTDGGESWSQPIWVALSEPGTAPNGVRLATDGTGRLHVVWTEYKLPDAWPPTGAFYARSLDGGGTWEAPLQVADAGHGQIGVAALGDDEVHLVWRSTIGGDGTFHQWSSDGGETWSSPDRFDDRGGFSGLPSFAVDAVGRLHYVIGPVFYAMWDGNRLSEYQDVATEEIRNLETETMSVERAVIAVTSGNRLHVIFEVDFKSVWHTSKQLNVPPLPTPMPKPEVMPSPITKRPTATTVMQSESTVGRPQLTVVAPPGDSEGRAISAGMTIMLGIAPSALLVVIVVLVGALRRK